MEENYILAKKIVSKRFEENHEFYSFFVLAIYGVLSVFKNYKDLVCEIFDEVLILIGNKSVVEIMEDNGISVDEIFGIEADCEEICQTQAISKGRNEYIYTDEGFINLNNEPFIVCTTYYNDSWGNILTSFIHEFAHLVKGTLNSTYTTKGDDYIGYVIRNGLSVYDFRYYPENDDYSEDISYDIFDEVINCCQTTDAGKNILDLKGIITDKNILEFLKLLNKKNLIDTGYEDASNAFKPLWKNEVFRTLINDNIVLGNINLIKEEFDKICSFGSYDKFDDLLNKIDELSFFRKRNSKEMFDTKIEIKKMIDLFNKKTKGYEKKK